MAFIPIPNTAGVRVITGAEGKTFSNNFYYLGDNPWDATSLGALTNTLEGIYSSLYPVTASNAYRVVEIQARDMSTQFGPNVVDIPVPPILGTVGGDYLPFNAAVVITLRTGLAGRSFRGRLYHIGLAESNITGNVINTVYQTSLGNLYASLITPGGANNPTMVVASRYSNGLPRVTGLTTPVSSLQINTRVDTQRRRLP
jgi:hypothetical protein